MNFDQLTFRKIEKNDLPLIWEYVYKEDWPDWKNWDAPYFPHQSLPLDIFLKVGEKWLNDDSMQAILLDDKIIGTLSYYYEDEQKVWLEAGIILYQSQNWNQGMGSIIFKKWIDYLFQTLAIPRVGLTTWSGNERMMRVGEKIGMQLEGRMRNVRYYEGKYYDSIRMGILREEWEEQQV